MGRYFIGCPDIGAVDRDQAFRCRTAYEAGGNGRGSHGAGEDQTGGRGGARAILLEREHEAEALRDTARDDIGAASGHEPGPSAQDQPPLPSFLTSVKEQPPLNPYAQRNAGSEGSTDG